MEGQARLANAGVAVQAWLGLESVWLVLGLVALQTSFGALGSPARRTFVPRLLPPALVPAGLALTHVSEAGGTDIRAVLRAAIRARDLAHQLRPAALPAQAAAVPGASPGEAA